MKKWNQTVFIWEFKSGAKMSLTTKDHLFVCYCSGINIRTTTSPSNVVDVYLVLDRRQLERFEPVSNDILQRMLLALGRKAVRIPGPSLEFFCLRFHLRSGEEFCKTATLIGKALFEEFIIERFDNEGSADFEIKQTTYVPGETDRKEGWIKFSTFLARKHGLQF